MLERVMGIEPTLSAWKAGVLPLNYTRVFIGEVKVLHRLKTRSAIIQHDPRPVYPDLWVLFDIVDKSREATVTVYPISIGRTRSNRIASGTN